MDFHLRGTSSTSEFRKIISGRSMSFRNWRIDRTWTLFLDRDGVINKKIEDGYISEWKLFHFLEGVEDAMRRLSETFGKIILVTNQQGIGKKIHTTEQLHQVHDRML